MERKVMTRQQLYDLVWSMPMRAAAATIPMSDVGLKKVCRRYSVPVPAQGYWNKLRAGHRVRKHKLSEPPEGVGEHVTIFAVPPLHGAALEAKRKAEEKMKLQRQEAAAEPTTPTTVHECVRGTKRALDRLQPDRRGALRLLRKPGLAQILVWPERVERALKLLNKLCYAAERLGHAIRCPQSGPAVLVVDGQEIGFEITEIYVRREKRPPADNGLKWRRPTLEQQYREFVKEWVFVPSGKLRISLHSLEGRGRQKKWSDRLARPLESQLGKVISEAVAHAAAMREWALENERREATWEEAERRREAERERKQREERRRAFLIEKADAYDEAERLMTFVAHLRRKTGRSRLPQLSALLEWATDHLGSLRASCSVDKIEKDLAWSGLFK